MSSQEFLRQTDGIELHTLDQVQGSYRFLDPIYQAFRASSVDAFKYDSVLDFADQTMYFALILEKDSSQLAAQAESKLRTGSTTQGIPSPARSPSPPPPTPMVKPVPQVHPFATPRVLQEEEGPVVANPSNSQSGSGNAPQTSPESALPPSGSNTATRAPQRRKAKDDPWDSSSDSDDTCEGDDVVVDAATGWVFRAFTKTGPPSRGQKELTNPIPDSPQPPSCKIPRMSPTLASVLNSRAAEELGRRAFRDAHILDRYGLPLATAVQPKRVAITIPELDGVIPHIPAPQRGSGSNTHSHGTVRWSGNEPSSSTTSLRRTDDWEEPKSVLSTRPLNVKHKKSKRNARASRLRAAASPPVSSWESYVPQPLINNEDPPASPPFSTWESYIPPSRMNTEDPPLPRNYIGFVYLTIPFTEGESNVGVMVKEEYRRAGAANQAMDLILSCAFEELKLHRVQALVPDSPTKDSAITFFIQKCFTHEGTRRRSAYGPTGVWSDVTYLSMLDTDWTMHGYVKPVPRSLWDEMFVRHQREREELLRWDEGRLKRTTSLETIRGPLPGNGVHEAMYDSSAVSESGGDTDSFVSFPNTASGAPTRPSTEFGSERDDGEVLSSLPSSSRGSPSLSSVSSASRQWEVLSSASEPLISDSEVSDFEMLDD